MNYIEVKIPRPANRDVADLLVAGLADKGFESFVEEEDVILAYIPQDDFSAELLADVDLLSEIDSSGWQVTVIADQNWNALWESNYPPVMIAGRCFIHAPFHEPDPSAEFNILIKPKMAFGTAHHETTAMMVELLLEENVEGRRVLDMGCGTGVLAILTAMKGAQEVVAIDIDAWAYHNTIENVDANPVRNVSVEQGDAASLEKHSPFHLILANINKNILLKDMDSYAAVLEPDGKILFSGFYADDLLDIRQAAEQNNLNYVSHKNRNKWVAAVFVKQ